jgi:hypothetical protein
MIQRNLRLILCSDLVRTIRSEGKGEGTTAIPDTHHISGIVHARNGRLRSRGNMDIGIVHVIEDYPAAHGVGASQLFNGFFVREIHNHTLLLFFLTGFSGLLPYSLSRKSVATGKGRIATGGGA